MSKKEHVEAKEQEIKSVELKRCPFCGDGKRMRDAQGYDKDPGERVYWIFCKCGASGPHKKTFDDAVIAWNGRW